jgi:nitrogen fixation NifU-like protein
MITSAPDAPIDEGTLGKLMVFSGVREYPVRIKCATLAWHAVAAALDGAGEAPVSTE